MLYFNWRAKCGQKLQCDTWHVGEPIGVRSNTHDLESIQADGDELTTILDNMSGIPTTKARVQIWREPFASFILDNLNILRNRGTN